MSKGPTNIVRELEERGLRTCSVCKIAKVLEEGFCRNRWARLGRNYICKLCSAVLHHEAHKRIPKQVRRERERRWKQRFPEKARAKHKRWMEKNAEHCRESSAERSQRRRARERDAFVAPVHRGSIYCRDKGMCQICLEPVGRLEMTLDHIIPLAKGGTHEPANVQLAHKRCNEVKGVKLAA